MGDTPNPVALAVAELRAASQAIEALRMAAWKAPVGSYPVDAGDAHRQIVEAYERAVAVVDRRMYAVQRPYAPAPELPSTPPPRAYRGRRGGRPDPRSSD